MGAREGAKTHSSIDSTRPLSTLIAAVDAILEQPALFATGRVLLTFEFWLAGFGFLLNFPGAVQTMASLGLEPAAGIAALAIFVMLVGSGLVIDGRIAWLGAGMLGTFTLCTIFVVHHFWTMTGAAALQARLWSGEHLSLIGGLILVAILCHRQRKRAPATQ